MTSSQAMKYYFKARPGAAKSLGFLIVWDENKTVSQNAAALSVSKQTASSIRRSFGLKAKRVYRHGNGKGISKMKGEAFYSLRKAGWTNYEIAVLFKVTRQCVSEGCRSYVLSRGE